MKKYIDLGNQKIEYTLRHSKRARRIRFTIQCGGEFTATVPGVFSQIELENFMREKADWIIRKIAQLKEIKNPAPSGNDRHNYLAHRHRILKLVRDRLEYFNGFYNYSFNKVRIKSQKSCWGSCSRKGNLNFNYKLVFLAEHIADYVVVHELCHLKEFNHSRNFWRLVARAIPDYLSIRKELRRHSLGG